MSQPHEPEVRHYATETLKQAREDILRGSGLLLVCRAKVEKYREADLSRAKDAYAELQKAQTGLIQALCNARLSLLEIEESGGAALAAKLSAGLSAFNLMSTTYKPVYEALTTFAEKLPDGSNQRTSAAVIGRLMNNVKLGYYPTDPDNIGHILRGIRFPEGVTTNLLDPCCGCGKALRQLAQGNNCFTYGMELDEYRAAEAQSRLHRVGVGSFFHSRVSNEAFHAMLLNPPYLSVLNENGGKTRHEKRFLVDSMAHLMPGGLLIYIIPYYRLTTDVCRMLSDNFSDLSVWRFTDSEFQKFKQAVVMGLRKRRAEDPEVARMLEQSAINPAKMACIAELQEGHYPLPTIPRTVELFKGEKFNELELEQQLRRSDSFQRLLAKKELDCTDKRPLLPLSIGQVGLIGGSGMINGLIDCDTPHIIKGRIVKVRHVETEDQFSSRGVHMGQEIKEVISNKMIFNILTPDGFRALT